MYMYVLVQLRNRLRVVSLSLSPLCVIQKKTLQNKMAGIEAREMRAFHSQNFTWPSFPQGFFCTRV